MWAALVGDDTKQVLDAFAAAEERPQMQVSCVAGDGVSGRPDAMIGYAGAYVYFRQFEQENPGLFKLVSPDTYIDRNVDVPIRMLVGTFDTTMPDFAKDWTLQMYEDLSEAGYDVVLKEIRARHGLDHEAREAVIEAMLEVISVLP